MLVIQSQLIMCVTDPLFRLCCCFRNSNSNKGWYRWKEEEEGYDDRDDDDDDRDDDDYDHDHDDYDDKFQSIWPSNIVKMTPFGGHHLIHPDEIELK